jgi:hypothetical protein
MRRDGPYVRLREIPPYAARRTETVRRKKPGRSARNNGGCFEGFMSELKLRPLTREIGGFWGGGLGRIRIGWRRGGGLGKSQPSFQDLRAFSWFPRTSSWAKFGGVPFGTLRAKRCSPAARFAEALEAAR